MGLRLPVRMSVLFALNIALCGCATTGIPGATCQAGDCMKGVGTLKLQDGGQYEGSFQQGLYHGIGVLERGEYRYQGEWKHGEHHGEGLLKTDSWAYSGGFVNGDFHGKGELLRASGIGFRGKFAGGVPQSGTLFLPAKRYFKGQISKTGASLRLNGKLSGPGERLDTGKFHGGFVTAETGLLPEASLEPFGKHQIKHADGTREEVVFRDGVREGRGRLELPEGDTMLVKWREGEIVYQAPAPDTIAERATNNHCSLDSDEWVYFGEACRNGQAHGKGVAYSRDGIRTWRGEFRDGDFYQGTLVSMDGSVRHGHWKNFRLHGEGQVLKKKELVYKGQFRSGERHGEGYCFSGASAEPCEFYHGDRIDEAHKMRQLSRRSLAEGRAARKAAREAMAALAEGADERSRKWSRRLRSIERERSSVGGPDLGTYIAQAGQEVMDEVGRSQARTNQVIQQAHERQEEINRRRREAYERQLAEERAEAQRRLNAFNERLARNREILTERRAAANQGNEKPEPDITHHKIDLLPTATWDPRTGEVNSPAGVAETAGSSRGMVDGDRSKPGLGDNRSPSSDSGDDEGRVKVKEALALCWEANEGKWFCAGPGQETMTASDSESGALQYVGCDDWRQRAPGVHISRSGLGPKWEKGTTASLYYCDRPLTSYDDDLRKEFRISFPPAIPTIKYQCEALTGGGWSTRNCN